jgi:hypothetical protein
VIPKAHLTHELKSLNDKLSSLPPEALLTFPPLTAKDFAIFGAVIQTYNYIEFNLRRAMSTFSAVGLLSSEQRKRLPRLAGFKLTQAVKEVATEIHRTTGMDGEAESHLEAIQQNQPMRNLLAHWAARRVPDEDYFLLVGKDDRDARQVLGKELKLDVVGTCLVDAKALEGLIGFLEPHERWAAEKASEWYKRYIEQPKRSP